MKKLNMWVVPFGVAMARSVACQVQSLGPAVQEAYAGLENPYGDNAEAVNCN